MRNLYPLLQPSNKGHNTVMPKICEIVEARMAVIKDLQPPTKIVGKAENERLDYNKI